MKRFVWLFLIILFVNVVSANYYVFEGPYADDPDINKIKDDLAGIFPYLDKWTGVESPYEYFTIFVNRTFYESGSQPGLYWGNGLITLDLAEKTDDSLIAMLIHETAHGYHSRPGAYLTPWFAEGAASFVEFSAFYEIYGKYPRNEKRRREFIHLNDEDMSFINGWYPLKDEGYYFEHGYSLGYNIFMEMHKKNPNFFTEYFDIVMNKKISVHKPYSDLVELRKFKLSYNIYGDNYTKTKIQNNQMMYIFSEIVDEDLYGHFVFWGFDVEPYSPIIKKMTFLNRIIGDFSKGDYVVPRTILKNVPDRLYLGNYKDINDDLDKAFNQIISEAQKSGDILSNEVGNYEFDYEDIVIEANFDAEELEINVGEMLLDGYGGYYDGKISYDNEEFEDNGDDENRYLFLGILGFIIILLIIGGIGFGIYKFIKWIQSV